ncbi:MAG: hypothetical protein KJ706_05265 [Candidatus Omnitrophica bacterium]|nr:hypothetical protein [Candidatus Omnitrophota bacterium]
MKKRNRLPKFLQSVLWSYDLSEMDLKEDKDIIITQVLNYGDWKDLKWLYSVYSEDEIKEVVAHPGRGLWFERVLNFWEIMLGIRLPKKVKERAIFHIESQFPSKN